MGNMYSHSKLSTFEQCRLKFKYRYIDKIKTTSTSIESFLGKIVHDTLQWLYLKIKSKEKIPTIDELIKYYADRWQENYKQDIIIVKKTLTTKDYFNKGVEFLINYYTKNHPFDDNTLEVEKRIVITFGESGGYIIQGFIDRLVYNLKKNEYEIHDYKTSNFLPTQESLDNDRQLALYSLAIKDLFGKDKNVALIWHFLAHNIKIHSRRTNEQLEQLKKETIELIKKIESTTEFPSNKSVLCDWCEYNSICSEFKKQPNQNQKELDIWG